MKRRPGSSRSRTSRATAAPKRKVLAASALSGKRVKVMIDPVTGMNKTETAYSRVLEERRLVGEILEWRFEPMRFRLGAEATYTPDFAVQLPDQTLEFHDVKGRTGRGPGGWEDAARVKIKVAAEIYPWFRFVGVCRSGLGWKREDF